MEKKEERKKKKKKKEVCVPLFSSLLSSVNSLRHLWPYFGNGSVLCKMVKACFMLKGRGVLPGAAWCLWNTATETSYPHRNKHETRK